MAPSYPIPGPLVRRILGSGNPTRGESDGRRTAPVVRWGHPGRRTALVRRGSVPGSGTLRWLWSHWLALVFSLRAPCPIRDLVQILGPLRNSAPAALKQTGACRHVWGSLAGLHSFRCSRGRPGVPRLGVHLGVRRRSRGPRGPQDGKGGAGCVGGSRRAQVLAGQRVAAGGDGEVQVAAGGAGWT